MFITKNGNMIIDLMFWDSWKYLIFVVIILLMSFREREREKDKGDRDKRWDFLFSK